jgi:very-short-patch-repair endonuclease
MGILDMGAVEELLTRRAGQPGARRLRAVIDPRELGGGIARNDFERRFLALVRRARLPRPSVNEWMAIAGEEMQCDFVWHAQRVVVEVDGWDTHRTRHAFEEDRRRDRVLRLNGWTPLRFTWADVTHAPREVIQTLRAFLLAA